MKLPKSHIRNLEYIWAGMKQRCYNTNSTVYANYGGRGITVCDEWFPRFAPFYSWAMKSGYQFGLYLDRIDNEKEYSPANCRWVTPTDSVNNRRSTKRLTIDDETKPIGDWARDNRCSVDCRRIHIRLARGWSARDAVFRPKRKM